MGAKIDVNKKVALVRGVKKLRGVKAEAADLRGGAALVIAALAAEGKSIIGGAHHIERGYEKIEETFKALGGDVRLAEADPA
jgi:UDP-N-acetylglucosamine 1-carboxyvinyltransferase